jgi:hypothetical protein
MTLGPPARFISVKAEGSDSIADMVADEPGVSNGRAEKVLTTGRRRSPCTTVPVPIVATIQIVR